LHGKQRRLRQSGRQSTSLVNGLYLADSLAALMETEFNSFIWWDLRNGSDTNGDFNTSLYGWRTNGDLGIIGGPDTRYPAFYSFKLMRYFVQPGDILIGAASDFALLPAYAVRHTNGALTLLVINKDGEAGYNAQITITNFVPGNAATLQSYGIPQDEAVRTNASAALQDIVLTNFPSASTNFNCSFPPYSLTLFTFAPAAARLLPGSLAGKQFVFRLCGQPGTPYVMQTSTNLASTNWLSVSTNTPAGSTLDFTNTISPGTGRQFWRAVWQP
jgi:hypothetical protein